MSQHLPVLKEEIIHFISGIKWEVLSYETPVWWVDCTLGGGGHLQATLDLLDQLTEVEKIPKDRVKVLGLDRDPGAVSRGKVRFAAEIDEGRVELQHSRFGQFKQATEGKRIIGWLADFGFSSDQIGDPERGLSFLNDGPLDMRLDPTRGQSCAELLASVTEKELADLLYELGEERFSRRIASTVIQARDGGEPLETTKDLVKWIVKAYPARARHGRVHVATKSFQALRIAVNEEMQELDALLEDGILKLEPGGRALAMSFHSLEDRKVKHTFRSLDKMEFERVTRKPVRPGPKEIEENTRARSAMLRVVERKGQRI